jgi:hypothetical protein
MTENQAQASANDISKIRDEADELLYNAINHIRDTKILIGPCEDAGIENELSDKVWRAIDAAQIKVESAMTLLSQIGRKENPS